jgi:hypothetical protein
MRRKEEWINIFQHEGSLTWDGDTMRVAEGLDGKLYTHGIGLCGLSVFADVIEFFFPSFCSPSHFLTWYGGHVIWAERTIMGLRRS